MNWIELDIQLGEYKTVIIVYALGKSRRLRKERENIAIRIGYDGLSQENQCCGWRIIHKTRPGVTEKSGEKTILRRDI